MYAPKENQSIRDKNIDIKSGQRVLMRCFYKHLTMGKKDIGSQQSEGCEKTHKVLESMTQNSEFKDSATISFFDPTNTCCGSACRTLNPILTGPSDC